MKHLFLLIASFVLITSCERQEPIDTDIRGTVLEFGTEDPVEGAKLWLYGSESNGFGNPEILFFIDTLFTDDLGEFRISDPNQSSRYKIASIEKENYWTYNQGRYITPSEGKSANFVLDPFAWLRVTAENVEEIEGDFINFYSSNFESSHIDENDEYDQKHLVRENTNIVYNFYHFDVSNDFIRRDSIYCTEFDTTYLHINF